MSTRRDFLASLVGVAAATAACRRSRRAIPGEVRGASVTVGHALRGPIAPGEPARTIEVPVVIVGAGPSGLAAAWRLERLGEPRFVVLDLEPRAGGTSTYDRDGACAYPWGAHYVPVPRRDNRALVTVLREIGAIEGEDDRGEPVPREEMVVRDPEERIFAGGRWHPGLYLRAGATPADLAELARFQASIDELVGRRDGRGRRAFDIPRERSSDDADLLALDDVPMSAWLDREGFTSERLRWLVDYACRDDYGMRATDTSAWAGLFYFASRVAIPGRGAAELLAWPEGNGRFVRHFAGVIGDRVRTSQLALDVAPEGTRTSVFARDASTGELVRYRADRVVVATPRMVAARIVRPLREAPPAWLSRFVYGAWMVANVHLTEPPRGRGAPLAWDNVLRDSPSLGYVVANHQTHVDLGPTILTYYYPYTDSDARRGRERLFAEGHALLADAVLADLEVAHPGLDALVERIDVVRWGHAMAQPRVGFLRSGALAAAARPVGAIHFAHSDLSGMGLFEEALHHGVRAAEEAFAALHPDARWDALS